MAVTEYYLGTSIAIGRDGRRHISYLNGAGSDLRYATCFSGCDQAANWQKVTVDEGSAQMGFNSSLAMGPDGAIHVSYYDRRERRPQVRPLRVRLHQGVQLDEGARSRSGLVGGYTSLALEASGRIHISYFGDGALSYATCRNGCLVVLGLEPDRCWTTDGQHRVG